MDSAVSTLLARLEKVTARLESVEQQLASGGAPAQSSSHSASASSGGDASSPSVQAFDALISQYINPFVDLSGKVGADDVAELAALFQKAVNAQREMLVVASQSKKPSDDVLQKLAKPTADLMQQISAFRDSKRSSKAFNHLSTISEATPALGWVMISPTPGPHVADMRAGSEFYSNRILKDYKGKEQVHVDWVNAINTFLKELQAFIRQHHTTGLTWNPRGGDASSAVTTSAPSRSGPPPPPPPTQSNQSTGSSASKGADTGALFASLNKGGDITSGLKKVTNDMKSKNRPEHEKSSVVKASEPKSTSTGAKNAKENAKPPKFSLDGSKWTVEWQNGNRDIVISDVEAKQTLYIYKCTNSTIQVKGKINAITLDSCNRTAVVFESLVSTCDVVNCTSVEVQITGKVPSVSIDKTSGCQLILGKDALDVEIFSSKSSEMNVLIPGATPQDDLVEMAIPEQYKTSVKNGKLVTECNTHV